MSLTPELANLAPWSCKHNLHCNFSQKHIYLIFSTVRSLMFWQLW